MISAWMTSRVLVSRMEETCTVAASMVVSLWSMAVIPICEREHLSKSDLRQGLDALFYDRLSSPDL